MATCKKETRTITTVNLELTVVEAAALMAVFRGVGGSPDKTLRGKVDAVSQALNDALSYDVYRLTTGITTGSIYFNEELAPANLESLIENNA